MVRGHRRADVLRRARRLDRAHRCGRRRRGREDRIAVDVARATRVHPAAKVGRIGQVVVLGDGRRAGDDRREGPGRPRVVEDVVLNLDRRSTGRLIPDQHPRRPISRVVVDVDLVDEAGRELRARADVEELARAANEHIVAEHAVLDVHPIFVVADERVPVEQNVVDVLDRCRVLRAGREGVRPGIADQDDIGIVAVELDRGEGRRIVDDVLGRVFKVPFARAVAADAGNAAGLLARLEPDPVVLAEDVVDRVADGGRLLRTGHVPAIALKVVEVAVDHERSGRLPRRKRGVSGNGRAARDVHPQGEHVIRATEDVEACARGGLDRQVHEAQV